MSKEPAITIGSISAGVGAVIALCVAFGVPLTEDQQIAILGVVAAMGPIIAAVITRRFVSPTQSDNTHRADI
ncbi:TPA: hypothetical protein OQU49_004275 [Shigella flexneri]|nr:hypothetical protein [Shigella flexneri]